MNDNPEGQRLPGQSAEDRDASFPGSARERTVPEAPPQSPGARIQGGSIRLFRVAGIDVFLHWSWFFFALLRLQSTRANDPFDFVHYQSQVWYAIEYLALFGLVLLHEFVDSLTNCRV